MSFKREGDDQSQLNVLKKRRVADLLSNFIPEDEATLLKNGRYACLVCSHRPVFDTVNMLAIHRKGKRHSEGVKWFYRKKLELQNEIEKRRHQTYIENDSEQQNAESSAPLLTQTRKITHHALLRTTPYSSCHKKSSRTVKAFNSVCSDGQTLHQSTSCLVPSVEVVCSDNTYTVSQEDSNKQSAERIQGSQHGQAEPITAQRQKEMEHYLKLKSSGWMQDKNGKWVKDENVEFDSDEEEPPPLSPSEVL
ncbi:sodium channel modifier 1 isoform X2 [Denticeps clupeoides]|uniref:sodium channel modifier 1 isoform X2 n=1 Tax=Denticeps clupeoides TaxID=299321 RepID=UPI0010A49496|nr:sodium channel modifier 1 isoform X2 [Denticeps clupeoides]